MPSVFWSTSLKDQLGIAGIGPDFHDTYNQSFLHKCSNFEGSKSYQCQGMCYHSEAQINMAVCPNVDPFVSQDKARTKESWAKCK